MSSRPLQDDKHDSSLAIALPIYETFLQLTTQSKITSLINAIWDISNNSKYKQGKCIANIFQQFRIT